MEGPFVLTADAGQDVQLTCIDCLEVFFEMPAGDGIDLDDITNAANKHADESH